MTYLRALTCLALIGAASVAAPAPKATDVQPAFLPVVVGTKAVYEEKTKRGSSYEHTEVVTEAIKTPNGFRVTIEHREEYRKPDTIVSEVSDKGVTHVQMSGKELDSPMAILRWPARKGDTWNWEGPSRTIKSTFVGEEVVEVPAGKFRAVRVDEEIKVGKLLIQNQNWYASDVGLVKQIQSSLGEKTKVVELKSVTPGGK